MFKVNEYFGGKVMSMAFEAPEGPATLGLMDVGEYTFSTSKKETMKIVSGSLSAKLPGADSFVSYQAGDVFEVPPNSKFDVAVTKQTAYLCLYE